MQDRKRSAFPVYFRATLQLKALGPVKRVPRWVLLVHINPHGLESGRNYLEQCGAYSTALRWGIDKEHFNRAVLNRSNRCYLGAVIGNQQGRHMG